MEPSSGRVHCTRGTCCIGESVVGCDAGIRWLHFMLCFVALVSVVDGAASLFRWSADGKYLARKGKDLISIYELPSMRLLDKKSLKVRPLCQCMGNRE